MAAPQASPSRHRLATTYASTAPPATRRFGGLSAAAAPIRTPASTASVTRPGESERTTKSTAASASTIEGKSAIAVSPSAWGRNCSLQRSW